MRRLAALCVIALAACAASGPPLPPGSPRDAVLARLGPPTAEHPLPGGGRRLEYNGGAFGRQTTMVDLDASGRLLGTQQVRDEAHFNAIRAGMDTREVLSRIGAPSTTWGIAYQRQTVWSYRYHSHFCQWFMVGIGQDGRVADTSYGPDPLCERDDFFERMRVR